MRFGLLLSLVLLLPLPFSAQAGQYYYGVMAGSNKYEEPGFEFKVNAFGGKLGYRLNDLLAAEVHGYIGGSDDAESGLNTVSFNLGYITSAFVRADWVPVSDGRIRVFGLLGLSSGDLEFTSGSTKVSATEVGLSFGAGMELYANREHGIYMQWNRYLDDTLNGADYTLDGLGVGYMRNF